MTEQEKADRALDWIDAEADKWAVEIDLTQHIKNLVQVARLNPGVPNDVREGFIGRLEAHISALVRQTFLEAWLRCYDGRKEWEVTEISKLIAELESRFFINPGQQLAENGWNQGIQYAIHTVRTMGTLGETAEQIKAEKP